MSPYAVLDTVTPAPERVIFKVEYLEPSMDILDEMVDLDRSFVVS